MRRHLWAALATTALVALLAWPSGAAPAPDEPDRLYLAGSSVGEGLYPVSRFTPAADAVAKPLAPLQRTAHADIDWGVQSHPAPWRLAQGDHVAVTLYISGLDRLVPVVMVDPGRTDYTTDEVGRIMLQVDLRYQADGVTLLGRTTFYHTPDPTAADTVRTFTGGFALTADADFQNDPLSAFTLHLNITGRGESGASPVRIHTLGGDAASHVAIPGFPYGPFRAWEEAEAAEAECLRRLLQDLPCAEPTTTPAAQNVPAPGLGVLLFAFGWAIRGRVR